MNVNHNSPKNNQNAQRLATEVRREQIALAALHLIGTKGLEGMSIAGIAREIGLVPSAIYRHFKGKNEILDAVNDLIRDRLLGLVASVLKEKNDPVAQLHTLLQRHVALVKTHIGIPRYVFSVEGSGVSKGNNQRLYGAVQAYLAKVTGIIRQGQASGHINTEMDADTLAFMFLGLLQPAIFLHHLSGGLFDIEKQTERAWTIFSRTLTPQSSPLP
jgi:AcrR family transcriptional regulator